MIAALYVEPAGCYAGLDGVDLWDEKRDARLCGQGIRSAPADGVFCRAACGITAQFLYTKRQDMVTCKECRAKLILKPRR